MGVDSSLGATRYLQIGDRKVTASTLREQKLRWNGIGGISNVAVDIVVAH